MFPCDVEITDFRLHTASGAPVLTLSFCADGKAQTLRFLSISDVTLRFPAIPMQICGFEIRDHRADGWDADQRLRGRRAALLLPRNRDRKRRTDVVMLAKWETNALPG